jgi:hypothetical protein
MGRKFDMNAVEQDLAVVRKILSKRTREADPLGYAQFASRARALEKELQRLQEEPVTRAQLALFFGGEPVQGSRGIKADFAGKAVGLVQDLISKQFAHLERGVMARTGPVPLRSTSDMLITDIARGSVGLILEEAEQNESLAESELSVAVRKVADVIEATAAADATAFEELLSDIDSRYFLSLRALFGHLDDSRATVRLVENVKEFELDARAVHRARERTDAAMVQDEDDVQMEGRVFLLPVARRFELRLADGESIHGGISSEFAQQQLERLLATRDVLNRDWRVRLRRRTITRPNREPLVRFTLLGLIRTVGS